MSVYSISLLWLLAAVLFGYKKPALALPFFTSLQLLIPSVIKYNIGINMNIFNISVLLFCILSFRFIKCTTPINVNIKNCLKAYLLYVCLYSLIASFGNYPLGEYVHNMILFFFEYIGMAYCLNYVPVDEKSIKYFNVVIIASSLVIIIYGIFNYIIKINLYIAYVTMIADLDIDMANAFMEEQRGMIDGRISSTFLHPLQLGQAALLLFIYIFYGLQRRMNKILFWAVLLGLVAMIILCGSRSAIFPLVISIFFYLRFVNVRKKVCYAIVGFLLLIIVYPMMPIKMQKTVKALVFVWDEKSSSNANIHGSSISGRWEQYDAALGIIRNNLFWGFGNGYVKEHGSEHPRMLGYESFVLKELLDGGIFGVIAFLLFYLYLYKLLVKKAISFKEKTWAHSLCCSFLMSAFLTGIAYSFFSLYIIFYFMTYYNFHNNISLLSVSSRKNKNV